MYARLRVIQTIRASQIVWLVLSFAVGVPVLAYLALSLSVSDDPLLMPLDDTYIHFQYARQWAHGHPMVYSAGDPATSGGTSLLYPVVLALGWRLGFTGWSLAYWALAVGIVSFAGAVVLVYLIARQNPFVEHPSGQTEYALVFALFFALTGPFIWAALSGMETALFLFAVLLAFYAIQRERLNFAVLALILVALIRPEGAVLAGLGAVALVFRHSWPGRWIDRLRRGLWLALPLLAGLIQPVITLMATGTISASGMQAKSHLTNLGAPPAERVQKIVESLWRIWEELLRGYSADFGAYMPLPVAAGALFVLFLGAGAAWRERRVTVAAVGLAWIIALTLAVATLDTAFWQFKRYQLPAIALLFPAAAWFWTLVDNSFIRSGVKFWRLLTGLILVVTLFTTIEFAGYYADNVRVVRDQQVPMARWVAANVPQGARIGVHDVGMMAYFGGHPLYDVVGLTTRGPAPSWRQGPGAIYEHMADSAYRPDYFAIYPDVQGLRYLVDAGIFGEVLAEFPVDLPEHNVASATDLQVVYRADWSGTRPSELIAQPTTLAYVAGMELVDQVDVADDNSESEHEYHWWQDGTPPGFVTEVYRNTYIVCDQDGCEATDGGRVLTGGEEFTLDTRPGQDMMLVTRVHGRASALLTIYANGQKIAQRVQPEIPGHWIEIVTWVPGDQIHNDSTQIRIEVEGGNSAVYMPYYHWVYQGAFDPETVENPAPIATFGESIRLLDYTIEQQPGQVDVSLTWLGDAPGTGDGIVFVHLYNDIDAPPVAQADTRPAGGVLPPGNWLPGVIRDTYTLTLPDDLLPGTYALAVGVFDPRSGNRYPQANGKDRLFIGEITIEESPG